MGYTTAALLAKHFIGRRDVKAVQDPSGAYHPERTPWLMADIEDHLAGRRSLGHYLVSPDDTCRLFAFDIDLPKMGGWCRDSDGEWVDGNPRDLWLAGEDGIGYLTHILRSLAEALTIRVRDLLDIPTVTSYSGCKGLHVYGLTGIVPAADARGAATDVLRSFGTFEPTRGDNFWRRTPSGDKPSAWSQLDIEVFPKQDSLDGKDLGNLLRLPLGINKKSGMEAFFLDVETPLNKLVPADPESVLPSLPAS